MKLKTVMALAIAAAFAAPGLRHRRRAGTDSRVTSGTNAASGFSGLDRNNDGYISRDESHDAAWSNRFTELDKDNDGRLSQSEFDAMNSAAGASTTGGMGGSVGPGGTQSGSSTSGVGRQAGPQAIKSMINGHTAQAGVPLWRA